MIKEDEQREIFWKNASASMDSKQTSARDDMKQRLPYLLRVGRRRDERERIYNTTTI